ncbi:hypothetical protein PFZ55_11985 [Streptomyces sp. MS2A]|nr:hypothetical protein [Streptomyces sp. MS2A]
MAVGIRSRPLPPEPGRRAGGRPYPARPLRPAARYWTNAKTAASDPGPDFLAAGLQGTRSHRFLTSEYVDGLYLFEELGLIAVTDDEVGVFWSIGAY